MDQQQIENNSYLDGVFIFLQWVQTGSIWASLTGSGATVAGEGELHRSWHVQIIQQMSSKTMTQKAYNVINTKKLRKSSNGDDIIGFLFEK